MVISSKVVVIWQSGFTRASAVVFGQRLLYSGKRGCIRAEWLYSGKWLYWDKCGCIGTNVVVLGKKWLYLGKGGCIRAKVVVFGKGDLVRAKLVVFG